MVFARYMSKTMTFLPILWFEVSNERQQPSIRRMLVCLHPSCLSITNRIEPHIISQSHTKHIYLSQTSSKVLACCFYGSMWQIALGNEIFRGSLLNTQTCWKWHTHTWRAMTYRAGAVSPPSPPSLHPPAGFCRSSLISRRPPCLLRSPCSPWSNRAHVKLQRIGQISPFRSRTVNYKDAAWIDRCDIKAQSVTI